MTISELFSAFLKNLVIQDDRIPKRYGRITAALNKKFRDTESKTANSLQVGSYGRNTGISGLSDLDMIYILPQSQWGRLKDDPYKALSETRQAIIGTYSATDITVDRLVVVVEFDNYLIEVQPCFERDDGHFLYPDTKRAEWLLTMPREEMKALADTDSSKNGNLRELCKMTRAWRNKHGLQMGGLLIDTLAHRFLESTSTYDSTGYSKHDEMFLEFLEFLAAEPTDKSHYKALGSGQNVRIKKKFQKKAKKGVALVQAAMKAEGSDNCAEKWRKVFGRPFPLPVTVLKAAQIMEDQRGFHDTEEFIEDQYPVDIRFDLKIDCEVSQSGYRTFSLRDWLARAYRLRPSQSLKFQIVRVDPELKQPYFTYWKVLNRGDQARKLNKVRGQIVPGTATKIERTQFRGGHIVECYIIQHGVVVAKDRIDVPIDDQ